MPRVLAAGVMAFALLASSLVTASAQETDPRVAKAIFSPLNDSGIDGSASLRRKGDRTVVEIWADGAIGDHPTHIHQGSCDDLDPNPEFPLTNVQLRTAGLTGTSETTIDVPLAELLAEPHLILIHRSAKDIGTYFACGNIVAGKLTSAERRLDETNDPLPGTGSGPADSSPHVALGSVLAFALAALAFAMHLLLIPDRRRMTAPATNRPGARPPAARSR